jgi:hypothetical protein
MYRCIVDHKVGRRDLRCGNSSRRTRDIYPLNGFATSRDTFLIYPNYTSNSERERGKRGYFCRLKAAVTSAHF